LLLRDALTGEDIVGEPADPEAARDVLRRAADTVVLVDTGCGPRPAKLFVTTAGR
jgi:ABC-type sugar transport system substrate-binding protein